MQQPRPLETLDTEAFRRRLAGLVDPSEELGPEAEEVIRLKAISFCAALPEVFGPELDRKTLWDRIGSGIETALAKAAGDYQQFYGEVLRHIKATPGRAAANERLGDVLLWLSSAESEERDAWLRYLGSHLIPVLTFARMEWQRHQQERS